MRRRHRRRFHRNPIAIRRRHFRRNPIALKGLISSTLVPAAIGAGGAIAVDYLSSMVSQSSFGAQLQSSAGMQVLTNVGLALLMGWGLGAVAGEKVGGEAAAGAIVVTLYGYASNVLQGQQGGYGAMGRYMKGMGFIRRPNMAGAGPVGPFALGPGSGMGATPHVRTKFRIPRGPGGMGYIGPARTVGGQAAPMLGRYMGNGR